MGALFLLLFLFFVIPVLQHRYWNIPRNIEKYSYLIALQDRNEVLFYRCLLDNIDKLAPIIYTPTVGEACQGFSTLFRRPRGMYFSYADRGSMHAMVWNWPSDDVEIVRDAQCALLMDAKSGGNTIDAVDRGRCGSLLTFADFLCFLLLLGPFLECQCCCCTDCRDGWLAHSRLG
jgi:hypothetical protein